MQNTAFVNRGLSRHCYCGFGMLIVLSLICCSIAITPASAAALVAADQVGGYADQVLDKVARLWQPPADPADRKVRVKVRIDGDGKVLKCEPVASSALAAMDKAACTAVREAEKFGPPPYGLPIDVYLAFWTGQPVRQPLEPEKAEKPQATATTHEMVVRAEKVTKTESADVRYVNSVMAKISPLVNFPKKLPDGKYTVTIVVRVGESGVISQVRLKQSSGNADLDNAVMRASTKVGKVPAPPSKSTQDLNLTFVVQKP